MRGRRRDPPLRPDVPHRHRPNRRPDRPGLARPVVDAGRDAGCGADFEWAVWEGGAVSGWQRFDDQFRETPEERNDRLRDSRNKRTITTLRKLVADLSDALTDEGSDWSNDGLDNLRRRVANALPPTECPDWLADYRDPPVVSS